MPSNGLNSPLPRYEWKNKKLNAGNLTTFNTHAVVSENKLTKISKNNQIILKFFCLDARQAQQLVQQKN